MSQIASTITDDAYGAPIPLPPCLSPIGSVSQQLGVSVRAIRFYEEAGLITCHRDGKNARLLDDTTKARLQTIVELRQMDVPVADIAELLTGPTAMSQALRERLEAQLRMLDQRRAAIAFYLQGLAA